MHLHECLGSVASEFPFPTEIREFSFVPLGLYPWVLGPPIMEYGPQ